jgi:hypothetical protein
LFGLFKKLDRIKISLSARNENEIMEFQIYSTLFTLEGFFPKEKEEIIFLLFGVKFESVDKILLKTKDKLN